MNLDTNFLKLMLGRSRNEAVGAVRKCSQQKITPPTYFT